MKWNFLTRFVALMLILVIAACQPQANNVLPTVMDVGGTDASDAATATMATALAATNQPPALPATWTPSPEPTLLASDTPVPTPETQVEGGGHLFYIFNNDSVVRLSADGASEELILVGTSPADLSLSPDGTLLAYTAEGSGSASEVYVSNLDGTYTQRISCLGFSRIVKPTWSPDGKTLVFAGSQLPDGLISIYSANFAGSGDCPNGNNQHLLGQLDQNTVDSFAWNNDGSLIFFASNAIYGINALTGEMFPPLTQPTGFGPDTSPAHNPHSPQLMYLKTKLDEKTGTKGGTIYQINSAQIETPPVKELPGAPLKAQGLRWSLDGRFLAVSGERDVWLQDQQTNTSVQVVAGANFYPQPVFSPDDSLVAYVDGGATAITIQQIFVVGRDGNNKKQITFHKEGTISDLNWSAN
ncbi:MAG: hypothetical protein ABI690_21280 [Chloroflexota bacterium]